MKVSLCEKFLHLEFFWSVFSRIWAKYGEIPSIYPYSVQMQEKIDQKIFEYGNFSYNGWGQKSTEKL